MNLGSLTATGCRSGRAAQPLRRFRFSFWKDFCGVFCRLPPENSTLPSLAGAAGLPLF